MEQISLQTIHHDIKALQKDMEFIKQVIVEDFKGEKERKFSKRFIQEIQESKEAIKRGDFVKFKNAKGAKAYFDKL